MTKTLFYCIFVTLAFLSFGSVVFAKSQLVQEYITNGLRDQIELHRSILAHKQNHPKTEYPAAKRQQLTKRWPTVSTPNITQMPVAGYIPWGRTHCNSTNNPQNYYTKLQHQAYSSVAYYVNEVLGGILINGSRYLVKDINYNDGADCSLMMIIYQRMVDIDGVKFLFAPVNPDCSVLAKFAESRGILFGNGGDYSLLIERFYNTTTPYDYSPLAVPYGTQYSYSNLQWTFNLMNDITQGGESCGETMTNPLYIDQTGVQPGDPPRKVRTAVFGSNLAEVPYLAPQQRDALLRRNVTLLMNDTNFDLQRIVAEKCSYLDQTFSAWKDLNPDFVYFITGASNSSLGLLCMHQLEYNPPAIMSPTALAAEDIDDRHYIGLLQELPFFASTNFPDMIFGDYNTFATTYSNLWGVPPTFYELTFASGAVVLLDCILLTQSMDSYVLRDCIRNFNESTVYGQITFNPNGLYVDRPNVCLQRGANVTYDVCYPADYPNRVLWKMPSPFVFWQEFLDTLHGKGLSTSNIILIAVLVAVGVPVLVAGITIIVLFVVKRYFHIITIPKHENNEEWGNGGM